MDGLRQQQTQGWGGVHRDSLRRVHSVLIALSLRWLWPIQVKTKRKSLGVHIQRSQGSCRQERNLGILRATGVAMVDEIKGNEAVWKTRK